MLKFIMYTAAAVVLALALLWAITVRAQAWWCPNHSIGNCSGGPPPSWCDGKKCKPPSRVK
jgi:hypothetical protein